MLHRLYSPWQITNDGERQADRLMVLPEGFREEPVYVMHRLRISSRFHKVQMSGECDFVVLMPLGIMVIEVKGGIIGHGRLDDGHPGYFRVSGETARVPVKNPFLQADGNAGAVKKFLQDSGIMDVFTGAAVCFPECVFDAEGIDTQYLWHRGQGRELMAMVIDAAQDQVDEFYRKQDSRNVALPIRWKTLSEADIKHLTELLEPPFEPLVARSRWLLNQAESGRRLSEGMHVLRGLSENRRIMVQGPPGSGKSTYAFDLAVQWCRNGKKGIYLCWNELLAASMAAKFRAPDMDFPPENMRVFAYYHLVEEFALLLEDPSLMPTYDLVDKGGLKHLVKDCLNRLFKAKKLPKFDFIVADEAQDLFGKGLDQVIKSLLRENNPLENGNYAVFFDDTQAFPNAEDIGTYVRTRDTLKAASAYYMLFSNLRVNTGLGIAELIRDAGNKQVDPATPYGRDARFISWKSEHEAASLLKQFVEQEKMLCQCGPGDMIVLLTADLYRDRDVLRPLLLSVAGLEPLTIENQNIPAERVRFTTALKSKGLEWDVVFLVCSSLSEANSFQVFIGASRAKGKVYLLVKE